MKLITSKGELVLPSDFSFTIEQNSPAFSTEGTQSIPVNLPSADKNFVALEYPQRPGRVDKYVRKIPAKIEAGIFHKSGHLVLETASKKAGLTGAIMINESDLYTQIKEMTLEEVFAKIVRNDISGVENWYNRIYACMIGSITDDFTAFPVAVNLEDGKYQLLNGPDTSSGTNPWQLKWRARKVFFEGKAVNVPDGYGITPFLWLWKMLELLFSEFEYTVRSNPFKTDSFLKKIVLINNTADSICKGSLNYADLVPSCSIAEFIKWLESKFLIHLYIYPESKVIDLVPLSDVISSIAQKDITSIIDGNEKYIYSDPLEVSLSSDTSLEGAAPATDTINDLAKKYPQVTELSEPDFRNNAWLYTMVHRLSTGEYYEILKRPGDSSVHKIRLGSNYFRHYTNRLPEKKYEATDLMPAMVEVRLGLNGSKELNVVCPYIGDSRNRNTSYNEKTEAAEQKIIIALFAGQSDEDNIIEAKYCLGTTQKYNNMGVQWSTFDLTLQSLYPLFWKEWNNVLMNSAVEIEAKVDYNEEQLLSLRMDMPIILSGQKCIIKQLNYSVGRKVTNTTSRYILAKALSPYMEDIQIIFGQQLYRWDFKSNAEEVFADLDTQEWENYTWVYIDGEVTSSSFEFIPAPTEDEYLAGGRYFEVTSNIRITAKKINESQPYIFDRILDTWFEPLLIN